MEPKVYYRATLDMMGKWVTGGITALFLFIIASPIFTGGGDSWMPAIVYTPLLLSIYLVCYGLHPAGYVIENDRITIRRPFKDAHIARSEIGTIELLDDDALRWSIRTFAVGGLFGYFGKFINTKLGSMTWYATRRTRAVLIRTVRSKKIILTPDEAEAFVQALTEVQHPASL